MEKEYNKNGSEVFRDLLIEGDRYVFDFKYCTPSKGWRQYDTSQDAWYFGVWIHIEDRKIVTYMEGDVVIITSPTLEIFRKEIQDMNEYYGDPPAWATVIDYDTGQVTKYVEERPNL
jgi:hypothetical protein